MIQTFFIPLIPTSQGRPRAVAFGKHAHVYKDAKSRRYEDNLAAILLSHKPVKAPRGVGIKLSLTFYMPRPQGHYGTKGLKDKFRLACHTARPDLDNLCKGAKDSANGILWHDDSQVSVLIASKVYVTDGEPGTMIEVSWEN